MNKKELLSGFSRIAGQLRPKNLFNDCNEPIVLTKKNNFCQVCYRKASSDCL